MKRKIFNGLLAAALIVTATGTFVSCKDYEGDDVQQMEYSLSSLDSTYANKVKALEQEITNLQTKLSNIRSCDCNETEVRNLISALTDRVTTLEGIAKDKTLANAVQDIQDRLTTLEGKSDDTSWKGLIQDLQNQLNDLKGKIKPAYDDTELKKEIAELTEKVNKLQNNYGNLATKDDIKDIKDRLEALESQKSDSYWQGELDKINQALQELQNRKDDTSWKALIDQLTKTTDTLKTDLKNTAAKANKAEQDAKDANTAAQEAKAAAQTAQTTGENAATAAANAATAAANAQAAADKANTAIEKLTSKVDKITVDVSDLKEMTVDLFTSLITNVIVQSTYSPAIGELALPLDIQANCLVTYYGSNDEAFSFPTNNPNYFADADQATNISSSDIAGSKVTVPQGTLYCNDGAEGNAGSMYVTVNPSTVDVSGVQVALQNSQGTKSPVALSAMRKSNKLLTWGYTRAGNNNFYEIPATINASNLNDVKVSINTTELRQDVKNLINNRNQTKASLKTLAKDLAKFVYNNMNGELPRLALATQWSDKLATRTNVSEMNIMATAIQPLGFASLNSLNISTTPGIERLENSIANLIHNIKVGKVHLSDEDLAKLKTIKGISKITRNGEHYVVTVTYQTYNPTTKTTETASTEVNIDSQIDQLLATVNGSLEDFNSNIDAVNDMIAMLQDGIDITPTMDKTKADIISRITNYLDRFNSRFVYWFNRLPSSLHPVLLFTTTNGVARATTATMGTPVKGTSVTLLPTSYSLELFAPAYKKFVKCTSSNASDLKSDELGKVINGTVDEINVSGLKSGQTYEFLYEAVDYHGKVFAKKYYIRAE